MRKKWATGFTIVELAIVVGVIAILASVVTVAYGKVRRDADNTERYTDMLAFKKAFESYRGNNARWPSGLPPSPPPPAQKDVYCLGSGFPNGNDGQPRCRDKGGGNSYLVSKSNTLMQQLNPYLVSGKITKKPVEGVTGPYAYRFSDGSDTIHIEQVFSGDKCPENTKEEFNHPDNESLYCYVRLVL